MNILAIDTTTKICSIALLIDNCIFSKCFFNAKIHSKDILSIIDHLIKKTKIDLNSIDVLACNYGPGNFSSIRIGVSVIQGLSFSLNIPIICISSLVALAEGAWRKTKIDQIFSMIDACTKDNKVYWGAYKKHITGQWNIKKQETISTLFSIKKNIHTFQGNWAIAGTGWKKNCMILSFKKKKEIQLINSKVLLPNINDIITLSSILVHKKKSKCVEYVQPNYLYKI